jgi:hypothetical protein
MVLLRRIAVFNLSRTVSATVSGEREYWRESFLVLPGWFHDFLLKFTHFFQPDSIKWHSLRAFFNIPDKKKHWVQPSDWNKQKWQTETSGILTLFCLVRTLFFKNGFKCPLYPVP